jgi:hypothetical protein
MRLIEMQPTSGERLFVNPSFITALWPAEKDGGMVTVFISELPGSPQIQKQVKGPLEDLVARINAALHAS